MKRNLSFLFSFILLSFVFISCQKDFVIDGLQGTGSVKLRTYIEDARNTPYNVIDTFNVTYDEQDRILALISNSSGAKVLYEYNTGNYAMEIRNYDHVVIRDVSYINGAGLVDSTFQVNDTEDSSTTRLIYNTNRQVTEEREYDYSAIGGSVLTWINYYTYDNNGNMITYTEKTASGRVISATSYTYNSFLNTVFLTPPNHPLPYKNLPVTKSISYPGAATELSTVEYTYDNDKRVTSEKETYSDGTFTIKKYEYY